MKPENPPITIWKEEYRKKGIGKTVMRVVMQILKDRGVEKITGSAVYKWNLPSRRMHEALGFHVVDETEKEWILEANLKAI